MIAATVQQSLSFKLFADYFQFYLVDEGTEWMAPDLWTQQDIDRRLLSADGVVVVSPVRNMTVPVTVEIWSAQPPRDWDVHGESKWDHVVDTCLFLPTGKLMVHECTGGPAAHFVVEPGLYAVRACYGKLDELSQDGLEGNDHYTTKLWRIENPEERPAGTPPAIHVLKFHPQP